MNILITGAGGYIGSHLKRNLSGAHTVFAPSHRALDLLDGHKVEMYLKRVRPDVVIHTAGIGSGGVHFYKPGMLDGNIRMFFNLVRSRRYFGRMIHMGSGAVYDKRFPIVSVRETGFGRQVPEDDYGMYKFICSEHILTSPGIVDLRVFGIFGEGEDYRFRFISNAICRCLLGLPITIGQNVVFDYLDVLDFVDIIKFLLKMRAPRPAYNIGSGRKIDLLTIARKVRTIHGDTAYPITIARRGLGNEYTCSISALKKDMKQFLPRPIDESIKRMYQWYGMRTASLSGITR